VLAAVPLLLPTPARAQEEEPTESARGTLVDRQGTRDRQDDEPVADAQVTVTAQGGDDVDTVSSNDQGRWEVPLPGPGRYTASLDTETLPDDVSLAEGRDEVSFRVTPNQNRTVIFDLGARQRDVSSTLDRFLQLSVEGIKFGLVIAITAIGLSLIFGTTGLTNFAHGELVTMGAVITWYLNVEGGMQLIPATILAMGLGLLIGAALERGLWRPLRRGGMGLVAMMVVSIGLGLLVRNVMLYFFGGSSRPYNDYFGQRALEWGPISIAPRDLASIVISVVVLLGVALALQRTRFGKATRAVADNRDLAASSGIDVDRVVLLVWAVGTALAVLGGVLYGLSEQVNTRFGFELLLLMFAGITLGGLGTAYGAFLGSFIVGWFVNVSTLWVAPDLKTIGALVVLIVILMVRPQGILGTAERVG
jgi:branched-subunit amino acid ABC-type transport system permease component